MVELDPVNDPAITLPSASAQADNEAQKRMPIIKRSIEAAQLPAPVAKKANTSDASSSSAGASVAPAAVIQKSDSETMTKADLIEVIQSAFKGGKHVEAQAAAIAKENQEKAYFEALQRQTVLKEKQASVTFLQNQLKEGHKLSAVKRKEFEAKLEEILATICSEM